MPKAREMGSARLMLPRFRPPSCMFPRFKEAGSKLWRERVSLNRYDPRREDGYVLGVVHGLEVDALLAILHLDDIIGVVFLIVVIVVVFLACLCVGIGSLVDFGRVAALLDLSCVACCRLGTAFLCSHSEASQEKDCE